MARFALINYSLVRQHIASVHREGCADIAKDARDHGGQVEIIEANTAAEVVTGWINAEMTELGYTIHDVKVLPCCR